MSTNIFEVILNNPDSCPFLEGILKAQNHWISMKAIFDKLFEEDTFDSKRSSIGLIFFIDNYGLKINSLLNTLNKHFNIC